MPTKAKQHATVRTSVADPARPVVLAVTSDHHCGSTVGLCPEEVQLDDGGKYVASKAQRWLWVNWNTYWDKVAAIRKEHDAKLIQVFNGDMTDGDHHGTTQILSGNPTAQASVVNEAMQRPRSMKPDAMFFVRGTEAHVGKSAAFEERIALGLQKDGHNVIGDPDTGTASWWHAKINVGGWRFDFAHHGRMGQRPWTKPNVVNLLAFQIWTEHGLRGEEPPHFAFRSHLHQWADTFNTYPTRLIQTPAWQLATAYVHKVAAESIADVGGVIVLVKPEQPPEVIPVRFYPASPHTWIA